jgi:hypothetical protein
MQIPQPKSAHEISFLNAELFYSMPLVSLLKITMHELPTLKNLSISLLVLA